MRALACSARDVAELAAELVGRDRAVSFTVRGASMAPALRTGDRVVVAAIDPARLAPGDLALISGARPRLHRVIRLDHATRTLVTRGDALAQEDPPARFGDVVGRVIRAERSPVGWGRALLAACKRRVTRAVARR